MFLLTEQKPNMRSEMKILFKKLYAEQILVSIAFHTADQAFKRELKLFLLPVELHDFEILK